MSTRLFIISVPPFLLLIPNNAFAVDVFVESFDGDGNFATVDGSFDGLDNPDWLIIGDGELSNGGYSSRFSPTGHEPVDGDLIARNLFSGGSFFERVEFTNIEFEPINLVEFSGNARIGLQHLLGTRPNQQLVIGVSESDDDVQQQLLTMRVGDSPFMFQDVDIGNNISLGISFNKDDSEVSFIFDGDSGDDIPPNVFGPFIYEYGESSIQNTSVFFETFRNGVVRGSLDHWSLSSLGLTGDFNDNGVIGIDDIDLLAAEIRQKTNTPIFDVVADGVVDEADRNEWVNNLANTWFGDTNLDGEFNSSDLVTAFVASEYEDNMLVNSTWVEGDWDGNGDFNSRDLVIAFQDGGYEVGPREAVASVPEPAPSFVTMAILGFATRTRRVVRQE